MKYRRGVFCIIERDVLYNPLGSQNIVKYEKKIECSRKKSLDIVRERYGS